MSLKYEIKFHTPYRHWDINFYDAETGRPIEVDEHGAPTYWLARARVPGLARKIKRKRRRNEKRTRVSEGIVK